MKRHLTYIILILGLISCALTFDKKNKVKSGEIEINWLDSLTGDFSSTKNWDYLEGVYKNEFGQLDRDGLCPNEIDRMKDDNGKIYKDSMLAFYQWVDTTHQVYSIHSEAYTYEWAGTNFATAIRKNADTTICCTKNNASTHSRLILTITKDKCIPTIELKSVTSSETKIFKCNGGHIEIDKSLWKKGILKANFDFVFDQTEKLNRNKYWKGKIFENIENK